MVLPAVLALTACQFDASLPDGTAFSCEADTDCPPTMRCQRQQSQCVRLNASELAVAAVKIDYVRAANNPFATLTSARSDTSIRVAITLNQQASCLRLSSTPALVDFTLERSDGLTCVVTGVPRPGVDAEADVALALSVVDSLGMERVLDVVASPALHIDTIRPQPANVEDDHSIEYVRAPFGAFETDMMVTNSLSGAAGSVEPGSTVEVIERRNFTSIKTVVARADGSFGPVLFPPDPESVSVVVIDPAGNSSGQVQVKNVLWVVNHSGPSTNPHRVTTRVANDSAPDDTDEDPAPQLSLGRVDGTAVTVNGGVGRWQRVTRNTRLSATVYDSRRGRVLSVGEETTVWDGTTWVRLADGLVAVKGAAYDPVRDRVVVVSGSQLTFETWEFRFDTRAWSRVLVAGPPALEGPLTTFDPLSGKVLVIGGQDLNADTVSNAVYEFDGRSWNQRTAPMAATAATPRGAFDPFRGEHVIFGGAGMSTFGAPVTGDTLVMGADGPTLKSGGASTPGPVERMGHCMVWNPRLARVVLMGGMAFPNGGLTAALAPQKDMWVWDGTRWTDVTPAGGLDLGGNAHRCVYDRARGAVMVPSDDGTRLVFDDGRVQVLSRNQSQVVPGQGLAAVTQGSLVYAAEDGGTLVWHGGGWSRVDAGLQQLKSLDVDTAGVAMGVSTAADGGLEVLTFGPGGWAHSDAGLGEREGVSFFDRTTGKLVVETTTGAYSFNGQFSPIPGATGRSGFPLRESIHFSPTLGGPLRVFAYWTSLWSGSGWTSVDTTPDAQRAGIDMMTHVADAAGRTLLFRDGDVFDASATPSASGSHWTQVATRGAGPQWGAAAKRFATTFLPDTRRLWVHDGLAGTTWQLKLAELRPALLSHFQLPEVDAGLIASVDFSARAGGTGGARVRVFSGGVWRDPVQASSRNLSTSADGALSMSVAARDALDELLERTHEVTVAIEPNADNGLSASSVSVDYVQMAVRYRLP